MSILSSPPAGLSGCETVFRYVDEAPHPRRSGELWQIWYDDGARKAGPARLHEAIRITFAAAGLFDLEARDLSGEVLHSLQYRVVGTLADEIEAVAACGIPETQQNWIQTIRERGQSSLADLEQLIKDRFLDDPADGTRWGRGVRLLLCLYRPELAACRWPRLGDDQWEDALERVQFTLLRRRDYNPELPFRPYAITLLEREFINAYRRSGHPDPGNPGARRPFLDVHEQPEPEDRAGATERFDLDGVLEVDLDLQPLLIRIPTKLREGIRLSENELLTAARRNLEFAWEPRRRRPWTVKELEARAVAAGTTLERALAEQKRLIRACEVEFRGRDNRLPDPCREEEDPAWEQEQRRRFEAMRGQAELGRDTVGVLNEESLRKAIPWYSGSAHSRASTLFHMRRLADQMMSLFEGPLVELRGPLFLKLGERIRTSLGKLIEGYGRESQPHALRRFSELVGPAEQVVRLFDPWELAPEHRQLLAQFQMRCDAFRAKLRALQRLYPVRRLVEEYLPELRADWPLLEGLSTWLDRGAWRNHLSPEDRVIVGHFAEHLLETRKWWPSDDVAALHLLQGWLAAVARDDETALLWLNQLDGCWRRGLEAAEALNAGDDPLESLVKAAARWWGRPTSRSHKALLEWTCRVEDECRRRGQQLSAQGAMERRLVEEVGRRVRSFRESVAEVIPGRGR